MSVSYTHLWTILFILMDSVDRQSAHPLGPARQPDHGRPDPHQDKENGPHHGKYLSLIHICRVEHCSRPATLLAFTVSNPVCLVISRAVFRIISLVILAFGGMA